MLETLGSKRGHSFPIKIEVGADAAATDFTNIDVAIDFSVPEAAFDNITFCFDKGIPVISGTTGWLDRYQEALALCQKQQGAFIYASNFSLGVNIFFALNQYLAKLMSPLEDYKASMEEIHHIHKLDAPSGTAITLAEDIIDHSAYQGWFLEESKAKHIPIKAIREGEVPGTHSIDYSSTVDSIAIKHTAHNREGFALGALIAAEWIKGKTGVFSMKDVLNLT